jgi:hypothetical protein
LKISKPADGANLIKLAHDGDSNFIVDQLDSDLEETENLVNEIGKYTGTTILDATEEEETKRQKIQADGTWTIVLSDLKTAREMDSSASGRGDGAHLSRRSRSCETDSQRREQLHCRFLQRGWL